MLHPVLLRPAFVAWQKTEESEVRELSGKESGTGSGTPFCLSTLYKTTFKGGSGIHSELLPTSLALVRFAGSTPEK